MKKITIVLVVAALVSFSLISHAEIFEVEITAESLNVRDKPSANSNVIGTLKKNENVVATYYRNKKWLLIIYKGKTAYISSRYAKTLRIINDESSSNEACNASNSDVELNIQNRQFKCKESILGDDGYKSCTLYLDVTGSTSCMNQLHAFIYCEVSYEYKSDQTSIIKGKGFTNGNYDFYIDNGYGSTFVELFWKPGSILEKVYSVKVKDAHCQLNNLYD